MICSAHEMTAVVSGLRPLEDVMKRNSIYLVLRDSVGFPEPPQAAMMGLKVHDAVYSCNYLLGSMESVGCNRYRLA